MKFNLLTNVINSVKEEFTPIQSVAMTTDNSSITEETNSNLEFEMIAQAISNSTDTLCVVEDVDLSINQYQHLVASKSYKSESDAEADYDSRSYYADGMIDDIEDNYTNIKVYYRKLAGNYLLVINDTKEVLSFNEIMDYFTLSDLA